MRNNTIELIKDLISIPSYIYGRNNENALQKYIYTYLKRNLPWLKINRQRIEKDRYNIIAIDGYKPKLVFISHMDTVKPCNNKQLTPSTKNVKLFGLGAADMKSGLIAAITALQEVGKTKGVTLIFDCDEEYYFKGIKKVLSKYKYYPELVICPEPTSLQIINGCRGLIEVEFNIVGKTARAATPERGINAIEQACELIRLLRKKLQQGTLPQLGRTTVNLSSLEGGKYLNGNISVQANAVADVARVLLDIRTANPNLTAKEILVVIQELANKLNVKCKRVKVILDYSSYLSSRQRLKKLEKAIEGNISNVSYPEQLGKVGFYEAALVANAWKCPAVSFGPTGEGHISNEWVDIKSVIKTKEIFTTLIKNYI